MMAKSKALRLVERLTAKTEKGEIEWEETESEGVFQVSFAENSLRVASRRDDDAPGGFQYVLRIFNERGALVEQIWDSTLVDELESPWEANQTMRNLYEGARRKAMGVEEALDKLLEKLDEDVPF